MWTEWLPWRFVLSRVARSKGFLDPIPFLSRLRRLAQPSEVAEPVELLRAGVLFHARGIINAKVIQYNLDWAWPYWVGRQYDPEGDAFVPRAFSLSHVNLTHRNWTAVGLPDVDRHPIVDPRGLVTPRYDGWSLDAWLIPESGEPLLPSRATEVEQELLVDGDDGDRAGTPGLAVETRTRSPAGRIVEQVDVVRDDVPSCRIRLRARGSRPGWLVLALRPANPEGVRFIHEVKRIAPDVLAVNDDGRVSMRPEPDRLRMSRYGEGDVLHAVVEGETLESAESDGIDCHAGLATAAALFRLDESGTASVTARVPLEPGSDAEPGAEVQVPSRAPPWGTTLEDTARLQAPEEPFSFLYDAAVRSLVLHSPGDVYPGPYTYKRFWFRDAAFILEALCSVGLAGRARRTLDTYPERQERSGFFRSQEGEWDANGAALWAMDRYRLLAGEPLPADWIASVRKGARWVQKKRLDGDLDEPHAGLLPAGFSAEHLGPNDYYFWDDFWCAAGLRAAARILREEAGDADAADRWDREADDLLAAVDRSVLRSPGHRRTGGVPASPHRRMDAGAVGSLAAGHPLRLWDPADDRLLATAEHLLEHHMVHGGFFQDMIHSGINPYLTLHLAQVLLRAGDPRQEALVRTVAGLASDTGQWPEAVHPRTGGGCMGDGQHVWAASDWVLMMRSWFVREEGDRLILASGIPASWTRSGRTSGFGPTPTPYGTISVRIQGEEDAAVVEWSAAWRTAPPDLEVRLPGHRPAAPAADDESVRVEAAEGPVG